MQLVEIDIPFSGRYVPAEQLEQLDEPVFTEKKPAKQLVHALEEEAEYAPAIQEPVTAV